MQMFRHHNNDSLSHVAYPPDLPGAPAKTAPDTWDANRPLRVGGPSLTRLGSMLAGADDDEEDEDLFVRPSTAVHSTHAGSPARLQDVEEEETVEPISSDSEDSDLDEATRKSIRDKLRALRIGAVATAAPKSELKLEPAPLPKPMPRGSLVAAGRRSIANSLGK